MEARGPPSRSVRVREPGDNVHWRDRGEDSAYPHRWKGGETIRLRVIYTAEIVVRFLLQW